MFAQRDCDVKRKVRTGRDDKAKYLSHNANMAKDDPRPRWFLKEWRKYRGYSQERLAELIGTSKGYISDLERGKRRYNQEILEAAAKALRAEPADILMRDPSDPAGIWSIWDQVPPAQREQARRVLSQFVPQKTGTEG